MTLNELTVRLVELQTLIGEGGTTETIVEEINILLIDINEDQAQGASYLSIDGSDEDQY